MGLTGTALLERILDDGSWVPWDAAPLEVAADAAEQDRLEGYIQQRVASGEALQGLYPVNERTRAEYAAWLTAKAT